MDPPSNGKMPAGGGSSGAGGGSAGFIVIHTPEFIFPKIEANAMLSPPAEPKQLVPLVVK